ncbi:MAG: endonuclease/exonuclease/phosphatase family protein [Pyrinomonadaceae bacterium]
MYLKDLMRRNAPHNWLVFVIFLAVFFQPPAIAATENAPVVFSYEELKTLYKQKELPDPLRQKLSELLTNPFIENSSSTFEGRNFSRSLELGEYIRVVTWNVERGLEYEAVEAAFTDVAKFARLLDEEKFPKGSRERRRILEEAEALQTADVIILNEVDWGVKRSGYRNVAADLAKKLGMNYAFGVQFVELSPVHLSSKEKAKEAGENEALELIRVDSDRYKGLHGIAILSRFKLENVRLIPFEHKPYDWYTGEKNGPSILEKGKRQVSEKVFLEETLREVRRGGRTTLYAEIADHRLPAGRVTIAATHLENRSAPEGRVKQLNEILTQIKNIGHPVILTGDMNTSGKNLKPTSIQRELVKRFGNPKFWLTKGIKYALGIGIFEDALMSASSIGRTQGDPTVKDIPYLSPNPARKFFSTLEDFRFSDGGAFDFRGDPDRTSNGLKGTLANSNQRAGKGFVTTYEVERPIKFIGKYKLDWFFVKPFRLTGPDEVDDSYKFAPHSGRTLSMIRDAFENGISDHSPILVDLPLEEPRIGIVP